MRIHLGHHFYGAGNLGDDFMLAGFLSAMRPLGLQATFSCGIPFPLPPQQARFPEIEWLPCDDASRERSIAACDVWLGLGGSPFQHAQSRWFIDHLIGDAALCARFGKRMFYLGVGVQSVAELASPDVHRLCAQASAIWTRDIASADRLRSIPGITAVHAAADLAHILFAATPPPRALAGRVAVVANFDFNLWPGQADCLHAIRQLGANEHLWLAQESRELPGAERALHAALPDSEKSRWQLVSPERPGAPLPAVLARWPSSEWLVTSRFHAAIAGAWSGSKVVVIATNEKLRGVAHELGFLTIDPAAERPAVAAALAMARPIAQSVLDHAAQRTRHAVAEWHRLATTS